MIVFLKCRSLAHGRIKDLLADAQALRSNLQKLVGVDELQRLLKAEDARRRQLEGVVGAGGAGICQMLGLADVQLDVVGLAVLSDDHAGVHLFARSDKEGAAFLGGEQTVGDGLAGFKGDQRTLLAVLDISLVGTVAVVGGVQDTVSFGEEFAPVADQTARRDGKLQTVLAAASLAHALQLTFAAAQLIDNGTGKFLGNVDICNFHRLQFFAALVLLI